MRDLTIAAGRRVILAERAQPHDIVRAEQHAAAIGTRQFEHGGWRRFLNFLCQLGKRLLHDGAAHYRRALFVVHLAE